MKKVGNEPEFKEGQNHITVTLNRDERNALNEAVGYYISRHDKNDPTDNVTKRLKVIKQDLHEFHKILSPS